MADYRRLPCRRIVQQLPFHLTQQWRELAERVICHAASRLLPSPHGGRRNCGRLLFEGRPLRCVETNAFALCRPMDEAFLQRRRRQHNLGMPVYLLPGRNPSRRHHVVRDMERRAGPTHIHSYNLTNKLILHHPNTQKFEHKSINHHSGDSDAGSVGFLRQSPGRLPV